MERGKSKKAGLIILAYVAFISLGLPDGLLGVAWPSIRKNFSLPIDSLGLLLFASMAGYLTSSFLSGRIMSYLGVGGLLAASCALTGLGLIGYTLAPVWWMIIILGAFAGLGAGAIDAGINNYVAANFAESQMQWLHASFGIGITLGPIIMTAGINFYNSWRLGYTVVGTAQVILAISFALSASMWHGKNEGNKNSNAEVRDNITDYRTPLNQTLRQVSVWISILLFFIYAGVEASLGNWAYTLLTESRGIRPEIAGLFVGSYWASFTIGRIIAGVYTRYITLRKLIIISLSAAFAGAVLLLLDTGEAGSLTGVAIIGFAIAPIFPGMVSGTKDRVSPKFIANTIGMQIGAAGLGVAVLPGLAGALARQTSLEVIPIFLIVMILLLSGLYTLSLRVKTK
ncbi:MAG: MFS transporter [Bacillota bacterium]